MIDSVIIAAVSELMGSTRMKSRRGTLADFLALPDDGRQVEFVEGEIIVNRPPTLDHQGSSRNLLVALHLHVKQHGLGAVFAAPTGVRLGSDLVVEPDILFVREGRNVTHDPRWIDGAPDFIIEIASDSTRTYDAVKKRALYGKHGVREFWIVDPELKRVETYALNGSVLELREVIENGMVRSQVALPGFELAVASVFAR